MTSPLVLSNRYRLDQRLAAGGMGEVWKATDQLLGRSVAVKLLKQQYVSDQAFRGRFRAEARFAASLQHIGIAQVYDYGEQDDLAYLVMELVQGETLSRILTRNGRLAADVTLDIVGQAAQALQVAHAAGIIHRDIKPANLMVTADGIVKITDFGIARGRESTTMTQTGTVMGTAQYVSPEQATGETITTTSDLYSLGVVAYECLAGMPPFAADTPVALALKHVREDAPPLPLEVPLSVRGLVSALMAKDPADRPGDAREVAEMADGIRDSLGLADDIQTRANQAVARGTGPIRAGKAPTGQNRAALTRAERTRAAQARAGQLPASLTRAEQTVTDDVTDDPPRRTGRIVVATVCAVVLLGGGVFAVGTLFRDGGHSKLVNGNRDDPATPTVLKKHKRHARIGVPTDRPVPSDSVSSRTPTPTPSSKPTSKPTKTSKPPKPTPSDSVTDSPPSSPDPTPSSNAQRPLGSEGRV